MSIGKLISKGAKALKASKKAKQPKHSFSSMSPIDKAFTAAKISGRTMKSAGKIKHSEMHPPTAKFLNRSYALAAVTQAGLAAERLANRKGKKKK
mgnify:CR=1 FL=1|tara:strand:+ start:170 stop:454 length:285 start_codon:yes stop_codon:yes gene_type:complete